MELNPRKPTLDLKTDLYLALVLVLLLCDAESLSPPKISHSIKLRIETPASVLHSVEWWPHKTWSRKFLASLLYITFWRTAPREESRLHVVKGNMIRLPALASSEMKLFSPRVIGSQTCSPYRLHVEYILSTP